METNTTMEPYALQYYIAKYGTVENLTNDYTGAIGCLRMQYKQYEDNPRKGGRYRREKMEHIRQQAEAIFDELLCVSRAMREYFAATPTETPQIPTQTAETVNVSAGATKAGESAETASEARAEILAQLDKTHGVEFDTEDTVYLKDGCVAEDHGDKWCVYPDTDSDECIETIRV